MGQQGTPQNDRPFGVPQDASTTSTPAHRVGPLGVLHDRQRRWHPVGRVFWWAFLLPLAIFAWSSWRLRGIGRVGGYVLAIWVLILGIAVVSVPPPPQTAAASTPVGQAAAAPTSVAPALAAPIAAPPTVAPAVLPAAPAPLIVVPPAAAPVPAARIVAAPPRPVRPAAPKPARPRPAPARPAPAPAPSAGNAYGDTYPNVDGNQIQRPVAAPTRPAGATAQCKDGTWSFSQHRSGTCSGHGGIA